MGKGIKAKPKKKTYTYTQEELDEHDVENTNRAFVLSLAAMSSIFDDEEGHTIEWWKDKCCEFWEEVGFLTHAISDVPLAGSRQKYTNREAVLKLNDIANIIREKYGFDVFWKPKK